MPASTSSSAYAARQRLGARLRAMREAAGLSGRQFAADAGWADATNVTKVEKGRRTITADHIRLWSQVCGVGALDLEALLAEQANVATMWQTWQQRNRAGLAATQRRARERYERVRLHRAYLANTVHGLLQTEAYMTAALGAVRLDQRLEVDDVAEAVAERLDRQAVLHRPDARWVFVLEGQVLWQRVTSVEAHREQLRHLLDVRRRPTVSLGVIPLTADRTRDGVHGVWPEESFSITDDGLVNVELVSGYLSVTRPDEVAAYVVAWKRLFTLAVHGEKAAAEIHAALAALDES